MEWNKARKMIQSGIKVGTDVNTKKSTYRCVKSINDQRIKIPCGKRGMMIIKWKMLEMCFQDLKGNNGFECHSFKKKFPKEAKNRPCCIHTTGKIFVKSGIAYQVDRSYFFKN